MAGAAFVPLAALTSNAQTKNAAPKLALSPAQRRTLEAMLERLVPTDELGPGAVEMGAAEYIDRSLADALASEKVAFLAGLTRTDQFATASQGAGLAGLSAEKKDAVLTAMEAGKAAGFADAQGFFNRVRRLTLEGMFGDPYYGGNRNFAGWDLIRYPGAKLAVGPQDQRMNAAPTPVRRSVWGDEHGH